MSGPRRRGLALALIALLPMTAAAKVEPIPTDRLVQTMRAQLAEQRERLELTLRNDPQALATALRYIKAAETDFEARAAKLTKEPNYEVEARYVAGAFKELIVDSVGHVVRIMGDERRSFQERNTEVASFMALARDRRLTFDDKFYSRNKRDIEEAVDARNAWNSEQAGAPVDPTGKPVRQGRWVGKDCLPYGSNCAGSWQDDHASDAFAKTFMAGFTKNAPLIASGVEMARNVIKAGPGTDPVNPGGNLPGPGGGAPNGGANQPPTSVPDPAGTGPGASTPDWSDVSQNIPAVAAPAQIAIGANQALQAGHYAQAAAMARNALLFNPKNRDALAVLYAAQGRGAGVSASAAAMTPARSGAAALTPGGFSGEAVSGGASPSAEIAAAAASGAARLAAVQAQNGAKSALKLDNPAGALDILNKALLQDPNNPALLHLRAQTYGRLGRWEDALKDAVAGLALAPGNMALLNTKALAENRTRRWREALATADQMIAADPRSAWGYANRAHAYAGMGLRDKMLADINYAASLDPSFAPAAAEAAALLLPSEEDVMFLFPGEPRKGGAQAPAAASPGRGRSFSVVMGAGLFGGLLLALGLLSTVLAPLKDTVVSVFTRASRTGPAADPAVVTAEPASVAGNVGGLIRGQYEISKQIGAGGMGMVYEGTDRSLGRRVAIKKMREELRLNPRERERFIIEAKTVASLHHPNIVDIYAIAEEGEDVYLVFEFVDGKTVHDLIQTSGRLAVPEAVGVTRAMGEALTYAHSRGVIHRDMKPSNVMRTAAGRIKVMDFGIARMAKDALTRYSMTNTVVGTPPYMAPEQEQGVVRKESDVYSLAICAYEMLTGKLPFIGIGAGMLMNKINMSYIPPSRNVAGLPESLDEVFLKAFQADPDRRYRTPAEFVAALAAAADGARSKSA